MIHFLQIGAYAGGGGVSACTGAAGGNGGKQDQPAQSPGGTAFNGNSGTENHGGEGANLRFLILVVK